MLKKAMLVTIGIVFCSPAFATTEYFVEHQHGTHTCRVTEKMPDSKTWSAIGSAHRTMTAATNAMHKAAECK